MFTSPVFQAITRGAAAIDFDIEIRLPEYREHPEVRYAANPAHFLAHLLGEVCERFQIWTNDLDGIDRLYARNGLLDVVLNILGEVEIDSRQIALESSIYLVGERLLA